MGVVQIYVDGRRVMGATLEAGSLWERAHGISSATREPPKLARGCEHNNFADGYAYAEGEHWPIRYCRDCYTILAGRRARVGLSGESKPAWEITPDDLVNAKWAAEWPREGQPRRKRTPPESEWPDGY